MMKEVFVRAGLRLWIFLAFWGASFPPAGAQYVPDPSPVVRKKLEKWRDLKFGLLMHWGTYSQWGIVESWSLCSEDEPWCKRKMADYCAYKKAYEALKKTFDPVDFDPSRWARAARAAGMKYVVFTTKHHDGFCMFDTKLTDYKVTSPECPFSKNKRADIAKEIFHAFRKEGLWTGAYFSKPDWHSPYFWWPYFATPDRFPNYDVTRYPKRWEKFVQYTQGQIMELVTRYGPLDILWLDGGWVQKMSKEEIARARARMGRKYMRIQSLDIRMGELVKKVRAVQPDLIVVDRAVHGPYQNYLTPENRIPKKALPYPWESCITMGRSWSYSPKDRFKSVKKLVHMLVEIVSKGGNLLLNIGPGPDGRWPKAAYDRLAGIGAWLKVNGQAIYATRAVAPYAEGKVRLTRGKDGALYLVYLAGGGETGPPAEIALSSHRPPQGARITLLGYGKPLEWSPRGEGFVVKIPRQIRDDPPCKYAWTVKVSLPSNGDR